MGVSIKASIMIVFLFRFGISFFSFKYILLIWVFLGDLGFYVDMNFD